MQRRDDGSVTRRRGQAGSLWQARPSLKGRHFKVFLHLCSSIFHFHFFFFAFLYFSFSFHFLYFYLCFCLTFSIYRLFEHFIFHFAFHYHRTSSHFPLQCVHLNKHACIFLYSILFHFIFHSHFPTCYHLHFMEDIVCVLPFAFVCVFTWLGKTIIHPSNILLLLYISRAGGHGILPPT